MHISHTKSFNIPVSIALATLANMINVYEICLNTTNYPIFNMEEFRYCMWTSILDCFGLLVSRPWLYHRQDFHARYHTGSVTWPSLSTNQFWFFKICHFGLIFFWYVCIQTLLPRSMVVNYSGWSRLLPSLKA